VTNTGSGISTAVTLIGRDVKVTSADTGLANGKATWNYKLGAGASDVKLEVLDSNGKVVHAEVPSDTGAGDHTLTWDGKDLGGYQKANGGVYTLRITAKDSKGASVSATPFVQGRVTGVEQLNGKTLITVNGAKLPWESVTSISEAAATTTATNTTPTPSTDGGAAA
jgi:flagellar basal-body rod modification protein FlgD